MTRSSENARRRHRFTSARIADDPP